MKKIKLVDVEVGDKKLDLTQIKEAKKYPNEITHEKARLLNKTFKALIDIYLKKSSDWSTAYRIASEENQKLNDYISQEEKKDERAKLEHELLILYRWYRDCRNNKSKELFNVAMKIEIKEKELEASK